jgi:hypothetical protein
MKKNISLILLTILFIAQFSFAQNSRTETIILKGVIKDNSTLLPVTGAEVRLLKSGLNYITDNKGAFIISVPAKSKSDFSDILVVKDKKYWEKQIAIKSPETSSIEILLNAVKQRLIVTTDLGVGGGQGGDPDDEQSMVHLLVTANELDIEGIINGLAWLDRKIGYEKLNTIIDAYGEVLPNLKVHANGYPSYEYLKSVTVVGQPKPRMAGIGEGKDSPGSELIISVIDKDDDPRPVWLTMWGGANTIAQALWKVKNTRTPEEIARFIHKIRIYDILGQDDAGAWIVKTFPDIIYIRNKKVYGWAPSDEWVKKNVQLIGPLGAKYANRIWAIEGDSPAFFYLFSNGLNNPEKIDQGGWGGRFSLTKVSGIRVMDITQKSGVDETKYDPYLMYTNTSEGVDAITRWKQHIWNDLEARMKWSVANKYEEANHHPVACINGDCTKQILEYTASVNSKIRLDASKSTDPDGNKLHYNWYFYKEPGTYNGTVSIMNSGSSIPEVSIPSDAQGKTIHIILELSDDGKPSLYSYRRVIINVR